MLGARHATISRYNPLRRERSTESSRTVAPTPQRVAATGSPARTRGIVTTATAGASGIAPVAARRRRRSGAETAHPTTPTRHDSPTARRPPTGPVHTPTAERSLTSPPAHTRLAPVPSRERCRRKHDEKDERPAARRAQKRCRPARAREDTREGAHQAGERHRKGASVGHDPAAQVGRRRNPERGGEHARAGRRDDELHHGLVPLSLRGIVGTRPGARF